jgi:phytoene dehydrogenase-like protein
MSAGGIGKAGGGVAGPGRTYDAIVIGAGHNGLVAAAYLARAGMRTLVLERRDEVGGAALTGDLAPGFRAPTLAHTVGRLRPSVFRDLHLERHGLRLIAPAARAFLPLPEGGGVTLWADPAGTADEFRGGRAADAKGWRELDRLIGRLARVLNELASITPPDSKSIGFGDALSGLRLLRSYRGLGRKDGAAFLRVLPMPVADFVAEHVADGRLQAAVAFRGTLYSSLGPMAAGTTENLLSESGGGGGAAGHTVYARGGPGALTQTLADAARAFGAEIRTAAAVARIVTGDGRAHGVALASGEEIGARAVVSAIDPKHALLDLVDPVELGPQLRWRMSNYRSTGSVAKVNLALGALPAFRGVGDDAGGRERVAGRIVLAESVEALEEAADECRHGRVPASPPLEATIPTLVDPALAPEGKHVLSVIVQSVPYRLAEGDWDACRDVLGDLVLLRLEEVAPGISSLVEAREVIAPPDLESEYGLSGGHPLHGEAALDQWLAWRPILELGRYRTPIAGLYLAGSGSHPGGGITGGPGANAAREIAADI